MRRVEESAAERWGSLQEAGGEPGKRVLTLWVVRLRRTRATGVSCPLRFRDDGSAGCLARTRWCSFGYNYTAREGGSH